ncbi:hypothetical protein ABZ439_11515 [Streptomyces sp. NPDC005840]|uniref:hypothetical protein n=1 Tax=Streptomyces sp. NPDC005840 TaxID=3157072 RepID=UPI003405FD64
MAPRPITWDDLTGPEKRAILRADARGAWRVLRTGTTRTPATDRKVAAVYEKARQRIEGGK